MSEKMKQVARSGGVTRLNQVIDLVRAGKTPEEIVEWCEKQIERLRPNPEKKATPQSPSEPWITPDMVAKAKVPKWEFWLKGFMFWKFRHVIITDLDVKRYRLLVRHDGALMKAIKDIMERYPND